MARISVQDILNKKGKEKIISLTAYTYPIAKIIDDFCDIILVGDSVMMTIYGHQDTTKANLDLMINHSKAVIRGSKRSMVVVDIPAGSFEESPNQALETAKIIVNQTKCDAVKIEVDEKNIDSLKLIAENNINVIAHVGLLPQKVNEIGGYKYQGRNEESANNIIQTALLAESFGAFACVIEAVPAILSDKITNLLKIPTIGIGASSGCDGQILVIDDLIGLNQDFKPKFVKHYADLATEIKKAVEQFSLEVKDQKFPTKNHII